MKKAIGFGVLAAACVVVFGGCASSTTAKKDEAIAPTATAQATSPSAKSVNKVPETMTTTGSTAKQSKEATAATTNQSTTEQMKSALDKIYFDFDSDALSEQSRKALTSNAAYLSKHSNASVSIEGNCDERGSAEYNLALGEKRAKAAQKYLSTLGVADSRLSIISYGKEKPADPGHDESSWAKNRRDDFVILSK